MAEGEIMKFQFWVISFGPPALSWSFKSGQSKYNWYKVTFATDSYDGAFS